MSMINGIGVSSGSTLGIGTTSTPRGEGAAKVKPSNAALEDKGAVSTTVTQITALGAPVDVDRITALRNAIKGGSYRIDPQAIAGKMISADMGGSL
jgi:flagellar biosynthesis anti-sigma factor FlgM